MFPSPSVGPPLLSASRSPPLFWGIELAGGEGVVRVGAGGVLVVGELVVGAGAGVAAAVVVGAAAVVVAAVAELAGGVATAGTGFGAELRTTKVSVAVAWAPSSKRISR
jgi:hypothetical protein